LKNERAFFFFAFKFLSRIFLVFLLFGGALSSLNKIKAVSFPVFVVVVFLKIVSLIVAARCFFPFAHHHR